MGLRSGLETFIEGKTALDKLALALVWQSMSLVNTESGVITFIGNLVLTGWIVYNQFKHKEKMTNLG